MKAEILSIGSELTWGKNLDTNSCWLSERLAENGIEVGWHTTVSDDEADMVDAFRIAGKRSGLVIMTGGLGPTDDDLTRQVLANLAGVPLVQDDASLAVIEGMFAKRGRPMNASNRLQANFPQGATPIANPNGTAPGIWMEHQGTIFAAMPGVPKEMFPMFTDDILPRLRRQFPARQAVVHRTLRSFGAGEAAIAEKLGDMIRRGRKPEVGITASEATITLRITAIADSPEAARAAIAPDEVFIRERLGELIYGEESETLQDAVARLLVQKKKTLSTAESCTGGLVGHFLTEYPGISEVYLGGVVSYSNAAKENLLGVPADLLREFGAVSPEVAASMAKGCRERFGSDLAVAITGIAGPGGATPTKPVGLVHVALAYDGGVDVAQYNWAADRSSVKLRSAKTALNLIRLRLLKC